MRDLLEYMKHNRLEGLQWRVKELECVDGFKMSVQASSYHYCTPRIDDADEYTTVEVGFPSEKPQFFAEHADNCENYTDTVYGYVPIELVEHEIAAHGGIKK